MKKIENVFFGTEGTCLTSTSANHIANLAKEFVKGHLRDLEGMHFVEKHVTAMGMDKENILQKGAGQAELDSVKKKLTEIGEANSLIAWLREGIKAKNEYLELVKDLSKADYCTMEGIDPETVKFEEPDLDDYLEEHGFKEEPVKPEREKCKEEQDIIEGWAESDKMKYLTLKEEYVAISAAINQFTGVQEELANVLDEPVSTSGSGDQTLLHQKHPNVKLEKVNEVLEQLVARRRGISNDLREFRHRITEDMRKNRHEVEETYQQKKREYRESVEAYSALKDQFYEVVIPEVRNQSSTFDNDLSTYRVRKAREVGNLKIVIPTSLKEIYGKVSALGK